jgi:hypothetical protein
MSPISGSHLTRQAEDSKSIAKTSPSTSTSTSTRVATPRPARHKNKNKKRQETDKLGYCTLLATAPNTRVACRDDHATPTAKSSQFGGFPCQGFTTTTPRDPTCQSTTAAGGPEAQYNEPEFKDRWQVFTWTVGTPSSSHFSHNFKYEKTINNPDCPYELRPVDDWFEPGTHASEQQAAEPTFKGPHSGGQ